MNTKMRKPAEGIEVYSFQHFVDHSVTVACNRKPFRTDTDGGSVPP